MRGSGFVLIERCFDFTWSHVSPGVHYKDSQCKAEWCVKHPCHCFACEIEQYFLSVWWQADETNPLHFLCCLVPFFFAICPNQSQCLYLCQWSAELFSSGDYFSCHFQLVCRCFLFSLQQVKIHVFFAEDFIWVDRNIFPIPLYCIYVTAVELVQDLSPFCVYPLLPR